MDNLAGEIGAARAASADGEHDAALRQVATLLDRHGESEALLSAAADVWVTAVEAGAPLDAWPGRDRFHERLIAQRDCEVSPPILHHRIASQRSSGVLGHFQRAADALQPVLARMLAAERVESNTVLMALVLRSCLPAELQPRIAALHARHFASFRHDDLALPYSVLFDRPAFAANVADLANWPTTHRAEVLAGKVPIGHLLILLWLLPAAFDDFPPHWWSTAVARRLDRAPLNDDEAQSARLLAMRFGTTQDRELIDRLTDESAEFIAALRTLDRTRVCSDEPSPLAMAAGRRLDQRPRQALAAATSLLSGQIPF
ncbi:MAG: hypothetical protein LC656_06645, partial [Sphingomonadales bacterium]|nr:hypothetical protein [Sphingomonadales bacterium]